MKLKNKKMQSAMEYLMTYGWAILIIAVVLGALFSLGVFSKSGLMGTSCVAQSGYLCSNPILTSSTDTFTATVGQVSTNTWTNAVFCLIPQGATPTPSQMVANTNNCSAPISLNSGQQQQITIHLGSGSSIPIGTAYSGYLWANTLAGSSSTPMYMSIATVTVKST
ncbi:MAG: hypothetical protein QXD11_01130 [Candidatus Micrarchaeaceae archaeon]